MLEEYLILEESSKDVQKKLNQWRHNYDIEILRIERMPSEIFSESLTYCALKRTKK